jgi:hypothetical protein
MGGHALNPEIRARKALGPEGIQPAESGMTNFAKHFAGPTMRC